MEIGCLRDNSTAKPGTWNTGWPDADLAVGQVLNAELLASVAAWSKPPRVWQRCANRPALSTTQHPPSHGDGGHFRARRSLRQPPPGRSSNWWLGRQRLAAPIHQCESHLSKVNESDQEHIILDMDWCRLSQGASSHPPGAAISIAHDFSSLCARQL